MSFSVACAAAGSSTRAGGRSRSGDARPTRASWRCSGRSAAGCGRRSARSRSSTDEASSLRRYLDERGYSARFRRHFLVPLTSALWSTAPGRALEFPAAYAIRFFDNHGMLGFGRFRWRYVTGGSDTYVRAIAERLGAAPAPRARRARAAARRRTASSCAPTTASCGASTPRSSRRTPTRRSGCSRIRRADERARARRVRVHARTRRSLHTDASRSCRAPRAARASWNYRLGDDGQADR